MRWTEDLLELLGWPGIFAATAFIAYRAAGWRVALVSVGCLVAIGVLGVWEEAVQTMALMIVAVAIALLIGVPLGILSGLPPEGRRRAARLPRRRADHAGLLLPAVHGAAVRHRCPGRGHRHRHLRPGPGRAPHRPRHQGSVPVGADRGRRGQRRHRPPGARQDPVAAGPPGHPPRRQPGDHDGLRRRRHRRAGRLARPGPVRPQRPGEDRRRPGPRRRPGHRARGRHPRPDLERSVPGRAARPRPAGAGGQAARAAHRRGHRRGGRRRRLAGRCRPLPGGLDVLAAGTGQRRGDVAPGERAERRAGHRGHVGGQRLPGRAGCWSRSASSWPTRRGGSSPPRVGALAWCTAGRRVALISVGCLLAIGGAALLARGHGHAQPGHRGRRPRAS